MNRNISMTKRVLSCSRKASHGKLSHVQPNRKRAEDDRASQKPKEERGKDSISVKAKAVLGYGWGGLL